jgi:predicted phosphodiesterase
MRIAVLSDIHANVPALEAVLAAIGPVDAIWQLGDIVGYGPEPDSVVARLEAVGAGGVAGNHDAAALGRIESSWFNDDARAAVMWTAEQLGAEAKRWLGALRDRKTESVFTLVHGSPRDPTWEYVHSTAIARASFSAFETPHCIVGHTHVPLVFREDDGAVEMLAPADGSQLELDERRTILNPGSVGQPRDGDPRASLMVLDSDKMLVEWRRVAYPVEQVQERMRSAGLPIRLIERLALGL